MSEKHKSIVKEVSQSFEKNDLEGFLRHCTDDVTWAMVGDTTSKGKDAIRQWMNSMGGDMEPPKLTTEKMISEGNITAAFGKMSMKGESGKTEAYSFSDIYHFRGDKIAELQSFVVKTENQR